jgi:hypothetical protein
MEGCAFWSRLDLPGSDACRLFESSQGRRIEGSAAFFDGRPAALSYTVITDADWTTSAAFIRGFSGVGGVSVNIERTADGWRLDGCMLDGLGDCVDVDLGFTPATNLIPVRRLALVVGESAAAPAAWFDLHTRSLRRLEQSYERVGEREYRYLAPAFSYDDLLTFDASGFVRDYPGLWHQASL